MTTALYWLLRGQLSRSLWYHPMLLPTMGAALLALVFRKKPGAVKGILLSWAVLMLICYVWRMITVFPNPPMEPEGGLASLLMNWRFQ